MLDDYLQVNEVARRLSIHPDTVKRLCRQGDIPANKIHNTWLINKVKLEVFAGIYRPTRGKKKKLI